MRNPHEWVWTIFQDSLIRTTKSLSRCSRDSRNRTTSGATGNFPSFVLRSCSRSPRLDRSANKFQNTWTSETIADPVDKQENKSLSRRRTSNTIPGTRKKKRSLFSFPFRRAPYSRWRGEPTPMLRQKEYTGRGGTSARDASERNRANATHARIHASSYLVEWHVHAKGEATRGTP